MSMGVYINGMEMPCEEAEPLRIELYADGTVLVIKAQDDFYEFKAVPVPPHGRCIDADALIEKCEEMADKEDGNQLDALVLLRWFLEQNAPTIIPAEEGE
jgi:hypothetical protein